MELLQDLLPVAFQGRIGGLRDLQADIPLLDGIAFQQAHKTLEHLFIIKVHPGQVDGNGDNRNSLCIAPLVHLGHPVCNEPIQLRNMAAVFQRRNKGRRRNQAPLGMHPADQRLCGNQVSGGGFHHRLIVNLKFLVGNCRLILAHKLHLIHIQPPHGIIKYSKWLHMITEDALFRQLGPVDHAGDGDALLHIIDAAVAIELHTPALELNIQLQLIAQGIHIDVALQNQAGEVIRVQSAGDGRPPDGADALVEIPQDAVTAFGAKKLVGCLEVLDVHEHQGILRLVGGIVEDILCHLNETAAVIAAG